MRSLLDIAERAQQGPRMAEQDWDMALFRAAVDGRDIFGMDTAYYFPDGSNRVTNGGSAR